MPHEDLTPARRRILVARALIRAFGTAAVLVALYYVLPFDHISSAETAVVLAIGLLGAVALVTWEVRTILTSEFPALRAIEALGLTVPVFLLLFATVYYLLYRNLSSSFTQPLSRTDAIYFTVVTFSTVGYGDITAKSEAARLVVTVQILLDLVVLGLGVRVLLGAVRLGQKRRAAPAEGEREAESVIASGSDEGTGSDRPSRGSAAGG
jgi:hypothetical protein